MITKENLKNCINAVYNRYKENIQKIKTYNELIEYESIIKKEIKKYNICLDRCLNYYDYKNKIIACLLGIKIDNLILEKIKIIKNNFKNNNLEITNELLTIDYIEDSINAVIDYYLED